MRTVSSKSSKRATACSDALSSLIFMTLMHSASSWLSTKIFLILLVARTVAMTVLRKVEPTRGKNNPLPCSTKAEDCLRRSGPRLETLPDRGLSLDEHGDWFFAIVDQTLVLEGEVHRSMRQVRGSVTNGYDKLTGSFVDESQYYTGWGFTGRNLMSCLSIVRLNFIFDCLLLTAHFVQSLRQAFSTTSFYTTKELYTPRST